MKMNPTALAEVQAAVQTTRTTYNVEISSQAIMILGECFTAIEADPHQSWPTNLNKALFRTDMANTLSSTLAGLATKLQLTRLTSFDILHNMSSIIDIMCPFTKPPP
jgi:hypothetical protein